jgi:glutathione S-transferase
MDVILHHYYDSNYAEKARLLLGLKKLAWRSVTIPDIMPKPDLIPLTGGYSKTPVMQIGSDIFCDTRCIADELELRFSEAIVVSVWPRNHRRLQYWADYDLTLSGGRYTIGQSWEKWRPEFHADRAAMWGVPVDLDRMRRSAVRYRQQLVAQIDWLAQMLADGRPFLQGKEPSAADIAAYHILWFLHFGGENCTDVLAGVTLINEWMTRVRDIGHGNRTEMNAAEALDVARDSSPTTKAHIEGGNAEGFKLGERVQIKPHLAGRNPTGRRAVRSLPPSRRDRASERARRRHGGPLSKDRLRRSAGVTIIERTDER